MADSNDSSRILIYSNNPPIDKPSGGAQEVIKAAKPTWWVGPEVVADAKWQTMDQHQREARTTRQKPDYVVETFTAPEHLKQRQYTTIANEILWPLAHSMPPNTDKTVEELEAAYFEGYLSFNELANVALHDMAEKHELTADDKIWVHDYQCSNVPGMIYSRHIPWPSLNFLESVSFPSEQGAEPVKLLDTHFYRDFLELTGARALVTFQRPVDQANFIMTAAAVDDNFALETDNSTLQNLPEAVKDPAKRQKIQEALTREIGLGGISKLTLFGAPASLTNAPVGQVPEETRAEAKRGKGNMTLTQFEQKSNGEYAIFDVSLGGGKTANLTASDPAEFTDTPPTLKALLEPIRGRNWVYSVHRNDYTKGTLTKLEAAEQFFTEHPDRANDVSFVFSLQPTRDGVQGYREYAEQVFQKAQALKERFGDKSVVVFSTLTNHEDLLGLEQQPEMRGFLSLGHKDGHDLTPRELVDGSPKIGDDMNKSRAIGVIASSGIGAADVLGDGDKGAYVIKNPKDASEVKNALTEILDPKNDAALKQRFAFMQERSSQYDAQRFAEHISSAYEPAMAHRFGENWRDTFRHPDGDFIDRKGERHAPQTERPDYIQGILNGNRDIAAHERGR